MADPSNPNWKAEKDAINLHIGKRLRRRRRLLGLMQRQLGEKVGLRFQQIQKYEWGANAISAAMLWKLSVALELPNVRYFYEGLKSEKNFNAVAAETGGTGNIRATAPDDIMDTPDARALIRAVSALKPDARKKLILFAQSAHLGE